MSNLNPSIEPDFKPGPILRNAHFQSIFSSFGLRGVMLRKRFHKYESNQQKLDLDCGDGVKLVGFYNQTGQQDASKMAILIHGWEGCHGSSYMLSMASSLLEQGIDVFRLNLRDHGDTHALNKGLFNATLLDEVISAVEQIQQRLPHDKNYLVGFSLGGNFCLRVAANAHDRDIRLEKTIVFCPAIRPIESNNALLEKQNWLYHQYFIRRWKRSLFKKLVHFPDYEYADSLAGMKNLNEMNNALVPKYTGFKVDEYFESYAVTGDRLANTICPCYLHFSRDDMIIPVASVDDLSPTDNVNVTITDNGGHCGFLLNWKLDSWQDVRVLELINQTA